MSLLLILTLLQPAPDTLALDVCYREAVAQYPLAREIRLQEMAASKKVDALSSRYLPQVSLRGDAVYQSEVPDFDFFETSLPLPAISHDQYHVTLGAEQLVYDGGRTRFEKDVASAEADQAQRQVEVELYQLRDRVNQAFFNALTQQAAITTLETLQSDVAARLKLVDAQVEQGVVLKSNADVLQVELINIEQQMVEAKKQREAALGVLGEFLNRRLADDTVLLLPAADVDTDALEPSSRPEYDLFASTRFALDRRIGLTARENYPNLAAFGDASYGRPPGLNILENDFTPYYAFGVKLSWKLWDWKSNRRQRQALHIQQEIVDAREETFTKNVRLALQQQVKDLERIEELLERDDEIIGLRQQIVDQTQSQLENGVITATDYLIERNAAHRAMLLREQHRIQLAQARAQILTTIGEEG